MEKIKCKNCGYIGFSAFRYVRCSNCGRNDHEVIQMGKTYINSIHCRQDLIAGNENPGSFSRDWKPGIF